MLRLFLILLPLFFLANCATKPTEEPDLSATELYTQASKNFQDKRYKTAASLFADISYKHPYYKWAARARLMEIYSYYLAREYDDAIYAADVFSSMYPASPDIPYVYYMKALCYYEQIDIPYRDQEITMKAKDEFNTLVTTFPSSVYSKDGRVKLELIDDHLAAQEMIIGRFYMKTGDILASIKRFRVVIEKYQTTSQAEEALHRLVEGYTFLGLKKEAEANAAVLRHNYPNSPWYKESYQSIQNMVTNAAEALVSNE